MARQSKKQIAARPDTAVQGGPGGTARLPPASAPADLEAILGHRFRHPELLTLALTHRSYVYDSGSAGLDAADPSHDNEQLEFVGDAVLGLLAAELLCERYPALREGELTRLRASVVSSRHLGAVGARLGLGPWLRLGHTAEKNNARSNAALFANTVEALIAAIYQDGGLRAARRFVADQILLNALPDALPGTLSGVKSGVKSGASSSTTIGAPADLNASAQPVGDFSSAVGDHKSALQEMLQAQGMGRPVYALLEESGPDHRRSFRIEVRLDGQTGALAQAQGSTKKQAQQEAARLAVALLAQRPPLKAGGVRG